MANEDSTRLWLNGYLLLGKKTRIEVEEVSIDLSRDLKEHYLPLLDSLKPKNSLEACTIIHEQLKKEIKYH